MSPELMDAQNVVKHLEGRRLYNRYEFEAVLKSPALTDFQRAKVRQYLAGQIFSSDTEALDEVFKAARIARDPSP